jgi:hypothetical protein
LVRGVGGCNDQSNMPRRIFLTWPPIAVPCNVYDRWSTIIGVAADVRYAGMDREPDPEIYLPEALFPQAAITLVARTRTDPRAAASVVRARIAASTGTPS